MSLADNFILANGVQLPKLGLGVWRAEGKQAAHAVSFAIKNGYRLVDTASFYDNESEVGEGVRQSGVPRQNLFLTSKVWINDMGYDKTLKAFEKSLNLLKVAYLDMYMVHWPAKGIWQETWKALEHLYKEKRVRAIGVCNFPARLLSQMQQEVETMPMVNQVQFHPLYTQSEVFYACKKKNILLQAWAPLARGLLVNDDRMIEIAKEHNKKVEQVLLKWNLQLGVATIPKSVNEDRIIKNADIFDFELSETEMTNILAINENKSISGLPDGVEV